MKKIWISDPTLRDGNHAIEHKISLKQIAWYSQHADAAGIDIIEVGHGNGLGASSEQLGFAVSSDREIIRCARKNIKNSKLGVHIIPGLGKLKDIALSIEEGVDVIRVASHCSEADTTEKYIKYSLEHNKEVYGVLMMIHMLDKENLLHQAKKMAFYGASAIILMDSAGSSLMDDIKNKVSMLSNSLSIPIGFHAHNNLGLAVANSICAIENGATIIDGTINGFGAGAGNTILEVLCAVIQKMSYSTNINIKNLLELSELAQYHIVTSKPNITSTNILSGIYGIFSGFDKPIRKAAVHFGVDTNDIYKLLSKKKVVAGQEDIIIEVAHFLSKV